MVDPAEILARRALARPPHERAAYLDGACDGDAPLRVRVEDAMRLLGAGATVAASLPSEQATIAIPANRDFAPTPPSNASRDRSPPAATTSTTCPPTPPGISG